MTTKASHPSLLIGIVLAADLAIAVLGIRSIAAAHSAEPVAQNGRLVWAEQDTQRTSNYWLLAIGTLRNRYRVETSDYSPDLPDLLGLVGQPVTIWTDGSSRNVLGLRIANQTSLTLFGRHPALQRMWGLELGIFLVEIAVVPWAIYLWVRHARGRSRKPPGQFGKWRRSERMDDSLDLVAATAGWASVAALVCDVAIGITTNDGVVGGMWSVLGNGRPAAGRRGCSGLLKMAWIKPGGHDYRCVGRDHVSSPDLCGASRRLHLPRSFWGVAPPACRARFGLCASR